MNDLKQLAADLQYAAGAGAVQAGHEAVEAGLVHVDNAERALLHVEEVSGQFAGPLNARVQATQEAGVGSRAVLPDTGRTAEIMAETAAAAGARAVLGKR